MVERVRIAVLVEDQARTGFRDKIFRAEHGLSIFIEADRRTLFDAGATRASLENARLLGIDLNDTEIVILSHGHWDHTDGLRSFEPEGGRKKLVGHPDIFADRHRATGEYNGMGCTRRDLETKFNLLLTRKPYQISEAIYFLGEIPRTNDFEARKTSFFRVEDGERLPDFLLDDSALAIRTQRGLVIVTGCSHSGVCNIVEHAKKVCEESRVHAVLGGFHLLNHPEQLEQTIRYFQERPVNHLYPMHCTDLPALCRFHAAFGSKKLCCGDVIEIGTL